VSVFSSPSPSFLVPPRWQKDLYPHQHMFNQLFADKNVHCCCKTLGCRSVQTLTPPPPFLTLAVRYCQHAFALHITVIQSRIQNDGYKLHRAISFTYSISFSEYYAVIIFSASIWHVKWYSLESSIHVFYAPQVSDINFWLKKRLNYVSKYVNILLSSKNLTEEMYLCYSNSHPLLRNKFINISCKYIQK
jgi:hypothetical protein